MWLVVVAILAWQIAEQLLWGLPMTEFYFGAPISSLGGLAPVTRAGYSMAPIGFVVTSLLIGIVAMRVAQKTDPPTMALAFGLSLLGHVVYVLLVGVIDMVFGLGFLALVVFVALVMTVPLFLFFL